MKAILKIKTEVKLETLQVNAGVRYWQDAKIDGIEDVNGDLVPCRYGNRWKIDIDIETGKVINWKQGKTAKINYKVCDDGIYNLIDDMGIAVLTKDGYVPDILDLYKDSYGDYLILNIDKDGYISDWNNEPNIDDFIEEGDEVEW